MALILLFEDKKHIANMKVDKLNQLGHQVEWVQALSDVERFDVARKLLLEKNFDFLAMDIALEDNFGGIHIYNKLARDYREKWKHTLIWSMYTGPRIKEAKYGEFEFPIRIFSETAGIPTENIFNSTSEQSFAALKKRILDLSS
jgi:hypothetical protein